MLALHHLGSRRNCGFLLISTSLLLPLAACDHPTQPFSSLDPSPAIRIADSHQRSEGTKIVIQGKVTAIAPMIKQVAYEVQDESGVIWVLSNQRPPQRNSQVKVHGVLRSSNGERYLDQK
jgi:hypothetical protein